MSTYRTDTMIQCLPRGICSWNFDISGAGHHARAEFNWLGEQGALVIDNEPFAVTKHGVFSGRWTLDSDRGCLLTGQKTNVFTRTFEITGSFGTAVLRARSAMGRTMVVEGPGFDFTIAPAHAFTRRATITGSRIDFLIASFTFWLTVLTWRRAANSDGGGGAT